MDLPDTHLDLGCGTVPRNPYGRRWLYGVDIREVPSSEFFQSRVANLALEPIPYADNMFGSLSAFDFIEHVPRVLATADGRQTIFPFIRLMNEIWRVMAPGGRLYALTPTYPSAEAFVDPTHVNIITERTHAYFCGDKPMGAMYGFTGRFIMRRAEWVRYKDALTAVPSAADIAAKKRNDAPLRRLAFNLRELLRVLRGKRSWSWPLETRAYFLWELEAVK